MSEFLNEAVPRMPPMSMAMIEQVGETTLALLCPEALTRPMAIDFLELVERDLPRYGIFVYPASWDELGDRLAATDPSGTKEIDILLLEELWDQLLIGGRLAHRARATIAHELSHAILHVPVVRRRLASPHSKLLLSRVRRDTLQAFEDPEWQGWALAGCIVAPRKMIEADKDADIAELAERFGVSEGMMRSHLKRLRITRRSSPSEP